MPPRRFEVGRRDPTCRARRRRNGNACQSENQSCARACTRKSLTFLGRRQVRTQSWCRCGAERESQCALSFPSNPGSRQSSLTTLSIGACATTRRGISRRSEIAVVGAALVAALGQPQCLPLRARNDIFMVSKCPSAGDQRLLEESWRGRLARGGGHSFAALRTGSARARERDAPADRGRDARATSLRTLFSWFLGTRQRTGMSECIENTQSEIPRFARNDNSKEVVTQTPLGSGWRQQRGRVKVFPVELSHFGIAVYGRP